MNLLLGLILLAAAFAILAYPLYQSRARALIGSGGAFSELEAQRDGLYATLRDLDLDYELGKLDVEDYTARREKYLARASLVLQQLDLERSTNEEESDLGEEIEREVAALRRPPSDIRRPPVAVPGSIGTIAQPLPANEENRKWLGDEVPGASAASSSSIPHLPRRQGRGQIPERRDETPG